MTWTSVPPPCARSARAPSERKRNAWRATSALQRSKSSAVCVHDRAAAPDDRRVPCARSRRRRRSRRARRGTRPPPRARRSSSSATSTSARIACAPRPRTASSVSSLWAIAAHDQPSARARSRIAPPRFLAPSVTSAGISRSSSGGGVGCHGHSRTRIRVLFQVGTKGDCRGGRADQDDALHHSGLPVADLERAIASYRACARARAHDDRPRRPRGWRSRSSWTRSGAGVELFALETAGRGGLGGSDRRAAEADTGTSRSASETSMRSSPAPSPPAAARCGTRVPRRSPASASPS